MWEHWLPLTIVYSPLYQAFSWIKRRILRVKWGEGTVWKYPAPLCAQQGITMLSSQQRETSTHRDPSTVLHWTQSWTWSLTWWPFKSDVLPKCQQAPPGWLKGPFAGFPRFLQTHFKKVICSLCWDGNKLNYSSGVVIYHIMVDCFTAWKSRDSVLSQLPLIFQAVVLEIFKEHVLFSSKNLPSCKHSISNSRKMFLLLACHSLLN